MKKYYAADSVLADDIRDLDGWQGDYSALYLAGETDAEIARLKAANQSAKHEAGLVCLDYDKVEAQCNEMKARIAQLANERDVAIRLAGHTAPALDAKIQECDLLKAEVSSLQEITEDLQQSSIMKDNYAQVLRDRNDLLKDALALLLKSGAFMLVGGVYYERHGTLFQVPIPEDIAPLIAEAQAAIQQQPGD